MKTDISDSGVYICIARNNAGTAIGQVRLQVSGKCRIHFGCHCDRMVVGFTATCAISAYHHGSCDFESRSWSGVHNATLCDKVCQ